MNRPLLALAWQGVVAHRRRTTVLAVVTALGVVAVSVSLGLQRWSHETLLDLTSRGAHGLGHVERPDYHRILDPALRFPEQPAPFDRETLGTPGLRWTPELVIPALAEGPRDRAPVRLDGTREGLLASQDSARAAGGERGVAPDAAPRDPASTAEATLGFDLARRLGIEAGTRFQVRYLDANGVERVASLRARPPASGVGGSNERFTIALTLDDLQALFGERSVTTLGVAFDDRPDPDRALERLERLRGALRDPALTLASWRETSPDLEGLTEMQSRSVWLLVVILALVQTLGVANAFVLGLVDRTRDLGVLLALGLKPGELRRLIHLEAGLTSGVGCALGLLLAIPVAWSLRVHGLDFSGSARSMEVAGVVLPPVVRAHIGGAEIAWGLALSLLVAPLAGWWPARRIARLDPVVALRSP